MNHSPSKGVEEQPDPLMKGQLSELSKLPSSLQQQQQQQQHDDNQQRDDDDDGDDNNASLLAVLTAWAESTSVHGVHEILDREHFQLWKRALWVIIVGTAFGGMISQLVTLIQDYKEFKVTSTLEMVVPSALPFPQVTVCNVNLFNSTLQEETGIYEPTNEEELYRISTPLEHFIEYTEFNSHVYNGTDRLKTIWKPVVTPSGLCFQFQTNEKVFKPGYSGGLHFWAWLGQDSYDSETDGAGLAIFLTEPSDDNDDNGSTRIITDQTPLVMVEPGVDAFLSMQSLEYIRETESPWSKCRTKQGYSQPLCRSQCLNRAYRESCQCRRLGDPEEAARSSLPYCQRHDYETCSIDDEEAILLMDPLVTSCDCHLPPCHEVNYPTAVVRRAFAQKFLQHQVQQQHLPRDEFLANFVAVTINYNVIRSQVMTESKATSFSQLLSSIGGTMGLFAGISVISTFEMFADLLVLRLLPRCWWWGDRRLYGVGSVGQKKRF